MKRTPQAVGLVLLVAAVQPIAAIQVPQTRQEFVDAVTLGARTTTMERLVVEHGIDEIYNLLKAKSSTCLDVVVKRSGFVGNQMEVTSSDYNPTLKRVGGNKAEFALQVVHRPRAIGPKIPAGGLYIMAADIRSLGKSRTEVVLYRSAIGFKKIAAGVRQWAAGENSDCPKMK